MNKGQVGAFLAFANVLFTMPYSGSRNQFGHFECIGLIRDMSLTYPWRYSCIIVIEGCP